MSTWPHHDHLRPAARSSEAVHGSTLSVGQTTVVIVIFVLLASSTVLVPAIGYLVASTRLAEPLDKQRRQLVANNTTITTTLLLMIGVTVIGKGISQF